MFKLIKKFMARSIEKSMQEGLRNIAMLNPEKWGLIECSHCNGYGSSLKEEYERCSKCGGTGLVKRR